MRLVLTSLTALQHWTTAANLSSTTQVMWQSGKAFLKATAAGRVHVTSPKEDSRLMRKRISLSIHESFGLPHDLVGIDLVHRRSGVKYDAVLSVGTIFSLLCVSKDG